LLAFDNAGEQVGIVLGKPLGEPTLPIVPE
jgi:hypothetical protein